MPQVQPVWPLLDDASRAARQQILDLAIAIVGGSHGAGGNAYPADLERAAASAAASPEQAARLLEAAATLVALAVGRIALEDTADFVRELDEVDFVTEAVSFARTVDEILADPTLAEHPGTPLGGWPG